MATALTKVKWYRKFEIRFASGSSAAARRLPSIHFTAWDACYIRNAGILLDLRIVGRTLATAIKTLSQRKRIVRRLHSAEIELP